MTSSELSVEPPSATNTSTGTSCANSDCSASCRKAPWFNDGTAMVTRASAMMRDKIPIGARDAFAQADLRAPAKRGEFGNVHQLARRAVGLGRIEHDVALETDDLHD